MFLESRNFYNQNFNQISLNSLLKFYIILFCVPTFWIHYLFRVWKYHRKKIKDAILDSSLELLILVQNYKLWGNFLQNNLTMNVKISNFPSRLSIASKIKNRLWINYQVLKRILWILKKCGIPPYIWTAIGNIN